MNSLNLVILVIIIIFITLYYYYSNNGVWVRSKIDGHMHLVKDLPDKEEAADLLAELKIKLTRFRDILFKNIDEHIGINRLIYNFNPNNIIESTHNKYTSYSVDKGKRIVLCMRERDNENKLVDINTLIFVALHELAHVMTFSTGHTDEFWKNFRFLLKKSINTGCYIYEPYHTKPKKYCGTKITDTPFKL